MTRVFFVRRPCSLLTLCHHNQFVCDDDDDDDDDVDRIARTGPRITWFSKPFWGDTPDPLQGSMDCLFSLAQRAGWRRSRSINVARVTMWARNVM